MRMIDAQTYQLKEFWDEVDLEYAILSHRWEDEEVSFQDFQEIQGVYDLEKISSSQVGQKRGFKKIEACCMQARYDKIKYVWIDTCCIDKASSAELTEAINSMYRWYQRSKVCYAFLSDVSYNLLDEEKAGSLASSLWFTRGWTLQELVAPQSMVFYDRDWEWMGTKQSLKARISHITGIDEAILDGEDILKRSIAQRMSWASKRTTTRVEDIAYSLLGIFDVNMPLLYGEGKKAFLRLQEEIIRSSDDHTIFAWPHQYVDETGLLAQSPAAFEGCGGVQTIISRKGNSSYAMTNRGLSITLDAKPWNLDTYLVALQCVDERLHQTEKPIQQYRMSMFMRRLVEDDQFIRVREGGASFVQTEAAVWESITATNDSIHGVRVARKIEINVRQKADPRDAHCFKERIYGFRLRIPEVLDYDKQGRSLCTVHAPNFNRDKAIMSMPLGKHANVGRIHISTKRIKVIKLGFDFDHNPVCFVADDRGLIEETHIRDRSGNFTPGNNWMWTADEQAQFGNIDVRSCYDTKAWSLIQGEIAWDLKLHRGLWALKGDRVLGLSVHLRSADRSTMLLLKITKIEVGGKLVWDFSISDMQDSYVTKLKPSLPVRKLSDANVKN